MPTMPPTYRPLGMRSTRQRKREADQRRRKAKPWRKLYFTARWQALRQAQLAREPYCRRCRSLGVIVVATVVNHVERHQGDEQKFFNGPLESLCKACHDREVQREERAAETAKSRRANTPPGG